MTTLGFAINWTEYESGWGQRPDGHTLYLTLEAAKKHVAGYWAGMPKAAPNEYSRPSEPFYYPLTEQQVQDIREGMRGFIWGDVRQQVSPTPK